jgi:hypothetical protein
MHRAELFVLNDGNCAWMALESLSILSEFRDKLLCAFDVLFVAEESLEETVLALISLLA